MAMCIFYMITCWKTWGFFLLVGRLKLEVAFTFWVGGTIHKVDDYHFIAEKTAKKFCSFKSLLTEDPSWTLTVVGQLCVKSVEA